MASCVQEETATAFTTSIPTTIPPATVTPSPVTSPTTCLIWKWAHDRTPPLRRHWSDDERKCAVPTVRMLPRN